MPGAPPVKLVSVTDNPRHAVLRNEMVLPTATSLQLRPGGERPGIVRAAQLGPGCPRSA